jgi:hypothetical protein
MDYRAWYKLEEMFAKNWYITDYLYSEAGWNAANRRRSNACVHIYSMDEDVSMGFMGYWISVPSAKLVR